jgi:hypothetical protein
VTWKSKWFVWTGILGAVGIAISQYWSYVNVLKYRKYEASGMHVSAWSPWYISLSFWLGGAILFFSIIAMSKAKWLRRLAMPAVTIMAISGACLMLFQNVDSITDIASLVFFTAYSVLFVTSIASIAIIIASWLKKRSKK